MNYASPAFDAADRGCYECELTKQLSRGHRKRAVMDYKFIPDFRAETGVPKEGILSRFLKKDVHVNISLFGFSAGQELSTHSAPTPAVICILNGEADITLGDDSPRKGRRLCVHAAFAAARDFRGGSDDDAPGSDQASEDVTCVATLCSPKFGGANEQSY